MQTRHANLIRIFMGAILWMPLLVQAQAAVLVDIAPCMNLSDNAQRYACYDLLEKNVKAAMTRTDTASSNNVESAETPEVSPAPSNTSPSTTPEPVAAVTSAQPEQALESFGRQTPSQAGKVVTSPEGESELLDTIVSMQEREPKRWLFTLASGQVWYQVNSQRVNLKEGDEVRIFASRFGNSWRIGRAEGKEVGFVQVRRVQ